jgi:hypothetical protein
MIRITTFAIALMLFTAACGSNRSSVPNSTGDGVFNGKLLAHNKAKTPKGIEVHSGWEIDQSLFPAYDRGLEKLTRIAQKTIPNYPLTAPRYSDYTIHLFPRSSKCEAPAFLVSSQMDLSWDNHPDGYDKDPRPGWVLLCAAGMMMRNGDRNLAPGMVIAQDASHAENIVWFEGEHNELLDFWQEKYNETAAIHAHPILGEEGGTTAFRSTHPVYRDAMLDGMHIALTK